MPDGTARNVGEIVTVGVADTPVDKIVGAITLLAVDFGATAAAEIIVGIPVEDDCSAPGTINTANNKSKRQITKMASLRRAFVARPG
jgi:hypothetical protein